MTKRPTIYTGGDGNSIRPWNAPVRWKSTDAWSANGAGGGRAGIPGARDRQGWMTMAGGGRKRVAHA